MKPFAPKIYLAFFSLANLLALNGTAQAAVGLSLARSSLLPQVCLIKFFDAHNEMTEICSATLLDSRWLHSAGHCFQHAGFSEHGHALLRNEVICPNGERGKIVKVVNAPLYSELRASREDALRRHDSALALLDAPLSLPGAKAILELAALKELLAGKPSCALFGYGGLAHQDPDLEKLRGVVVDPAAIELKPDGLLYVKGIGGLNSGKVEGGDSGGSLACRNSANTPWLHIANISALNYSYGSLLAPLAVNKELFAGLALPEESTRAEREAGARLQFFREEIALEIKTITKAMAARNPLRLEEWAQSAASLNDVPAALRLLSEVTAEKTKIQRSTVGAQVRVMPYSQVRLDFSSAAAISLERADLRKHFVPEKNPFSIGDQSVNHFFPERIEGDEVTGRLRIFGDSDLFAYYGCEENVLCTMGVFQNVKVRLDRLDISGLR